MITKRGKELAALIAPHTAFNPSVIEYTCSLIARHARTHARLQEAACNRELTRWERDREVIIERRIRELVMSLSTNKRPIAVRFDGDPRGFTVKLCVADKRSGNTWGLNGEFGV